MQETRTLFLTKFTPLALCKWTRLFELMIGWRCWLKRAKILRAKVEYADYGMMQLTEMYKVVSQQTHGNGTKFIKFHLVHHFAENILDLGVMPDFDSGPPESNHKVNGKQPSEHMQLRAELLETQTVKQYYQYLVVDWGSDALPAAMSVRNPTVPKMICLHGVRFTFQVDKGPQGNPNVVSFQWLSKDLHKLYPACYTTWLIHHFFSQLPDGTVVHGCTEHKQNDTFLFHAHPAYRGHKQWYDWAVFDWSGPAGTDDDEPIHIPGQIIFFLEMTDDMVGLEIAGRMEISSARLFALIETLEEPLWLPIKGIEVVIPARKILMAGQKRKWHHGQCHNPNIYLVSVDVMCHLQANLGHPRPGWGGWQFCIHPTFIFVGLLLYRLHRHVSWRPRLNIMPPKYKLYLLGNISMGTHRS